MLWQCQEPDHDGPAPGSLCCGYQSHVTRRDETDGPAFCATSYLVARKLAMAPAPSADTEADAPDPVMPVTVIWPALVTEAVLADAWVTFPSSAAPPIEAPSAMLATETEATEPLAPI